MSTFKKLHARGTKKINYWSIQFFFTLPGALAAQTEAREKAFPRIVMTFTKYKLIAWWSLARSSWGNFTHEDECYKKLMINGYCRCTPEFPASFSSNTCVPLPSGITSYVLEPYDRDFNWFITLGHICDQQRSHCDSEWKWVFHLPDSPFYIFSYLIPPSAQDSLWAFTSMVPVMNPHESFIPCWAKTYMSPCWCNTCLGNVLSKQ